MQNSCCQLHRFKSKNFRIKTNERLRLNRKPNEENSEKLKLTSIYYIKINSLTSIGDRRNFLQDSAITGKFEANETIERLG